MNIRRRCGEHGTAKVKGPMVWLDMDQQRARRRLRSERLCAEPRAAGQAPDRQQRRGPRAARRAVAPRLRADADRGARRLSLRRAARADRDFRSRRRLAERRGVGIRIPGRAVRARRRAFRGARFHQCRRCRRQPVSDGRAGAPRGRLRVIATPRNSAATAAGFIWSRIRRARILPAAC